MFWRPLLLLAVLAIAPAAAAEPRDVQVAQVVIQPNSLIPAQYRGGRGNDDRGGERIMSLREIAGIVQARYGGRLLGADLQGNTYILRWELPNGDRRDFRVDATNGQIR